MFGRLIVQRCRFYSQQLVVKQDSDWIVKRLGEIEMELDALDENGNFEDNMRRLEELEQEYAKLGLQSPDLHYDDNDQDNVTKQLNEIEQIESLLKQAKLSDVAPHQDIEHLIDDNAGNTDNTDTEKKHSLIEANANVDLPKANRIGQLDRIEDPGYEGGNELTEEERQQGYLKEIAALQRKGIDAHSYLATVDPLTMDPSVLPGPLAEIVSKLQHDIALYEPIAREVETTRMWRDFRRDVVDRCDQLWDRVSGTAERPMGPLEYAHWSAQQTKIVRATEREHHAKTINDPDKVKELLQLPHITAMLMDHIDRRRHMSEDALAMLGASAARDGEAPIAEEKPTHRVHRFVDNLLEDITLEQSHSNKKS